MYELHVDSHFDAAHRIEGYPGECAAIHGHTWRVTVTVHAEELGGIGLSVDFKDISAVLNNVIARFDHRLLNECDEFEGVNPTAEHIARVLFRLTGEKLNRDGVRVVSATVAEGDRYRVVYRGGDDG